MLQHKIWTSLIGNWKWIFRHILKLPHVEGALFRRWKWAFGLPSHCILVDFGRGGSGIKHVGSASTDFYHHRPHSNPSPLPYHHTRSDQAGVKWANFFNHLSALKHFPRFSFQDRLFRMKKVMIDWALCAKFVAEFVECNRCFWSKTRLQWAHHVYSDPKWQRRWGDQSLQVYSDLPLCQ